MGFEEQSKNSLIEYLSTDFKDCKPDLQSPDERLLSAMYRLLYHHLSVLLDPSLITPACKNTIKTMICTAFVNQSTAPDEISPESLGLTEGGLGIFDPKRAPEIERRLLHSYVDDVIGVIINTDVQTRRQLGAQLGGFVWMFEVWAHEYREYHQQDPLVDKPRSHLSMICSGKCDINIFGPAHQQNLNYLYSNDANGVHSLN